MGADVEVDPQRPSGARVYDYYLGGTHHFAADREAAEVALAAMPELPAVLRCGRDFLRRAVTVAASAGLSQYLDLGAGIPAAGDVPSTARALVGDARIVSVDVDPVAVVHTRRLAGDDPRSAALLADLTDAGAVLESAAELLDLERPVCLLVVAVAHFIPDTERLGRALERYRDAVAPGSYLALSHACNDGGEPPPYAHQVLRIYNHTTSPMMMRERDEFRAFFGDWPLLDPGVVPAASWRPSPGGEDPGEVVRRSLLAGVAVKP
ncbi:SAM-dependent methyltransferase [Actinoplanes sp. NPDC026619]|uniref:SAM-dependent methyltransferase n=1 Tax=Actinoplanes sp. NPDC026619 TaxID=3155798 RepID=UPI0033ECDE26